MKTSTLSIFSTITAYAIVGAGTGSVLFLLSIFLSFSGLLGGHLFTNAAVFMLLVSSGLAVIGILSCKCDVCKNRLFLAHGGIKKNKSARDNPAVTLILDKRIVCSLCGKIHKIDG
jgi:hypothetical protein